MASKNPRSMSFAERVVYFPFHVDESPNSIERQYLLGGGVTLSKQIIPEDNSIHIEDHQPMTPTWSSVVINTSNALTLLMAAGLLAVAIYEDYMSRLRDPVLIIAMTVSCVTMLCSLFGFVGTSVSSGKNAKGNNWLVVNHVGAILCMCLMVSLAVGALIRWDHTGQPIHTLHLGNAMVAIKYRSLIWGFALGCALSMVVTTFGTLGRDWSSQDAVFQRTLFVSNIIMLLVSLSLLCIGVAIWYHGEMAGAAPVWIIGLMVSSALWFFVSLNGLTVNTVSSLNYYLIWVPVVTFLVLFFSIATAVNSEPQLISDRRTNMLLASLMGLWSQVITVVAVVSASRWRYFLQHKDILPEYNK